MAYTDISTRSYWIWGILFFIVIAKEVLGVGEKIWIIVRIYSRSSTAKLTVVDLGSGVWPSCQCPSTLLHVYVERI